MRLTDVIEVARRERAERAKQYDDSRAEAATEWARQVEVRRAELVAWLGEMADDFAIEHASWKDDRERELVVFRLEPMHWDNEVVCRGGQTLIPTAQYIRSRGWRIGRDDMGWSMEFFPQANEVAANFPDLWLRMEKEYETARERLVNTYIGTMAFDVNSLDTTAAQQRRDRLIELAPDRIVEWDNLLDEWHEARDRHFERVAAQDAAREAYRLALEEWAKERARVDAHNRDVVTRLQAEYDKPKLFRDLEYAVVGHDRNEYYVDTVTIIVAAEPREGGYWWVPVRRGDAVSRWFRFENVVSVSDAYSKRPSEADGRYFDTAHASPWGVVRYDPEYARAVRVALDQQLLPAPPEPDAAEYIGEEWTTEAHKMYWDVLNRYNIEAPDA